MTADSHARYLVELCAAALHHAPLPLPSESIDSSYLVKLISAHHLSGLLYPLFSTEQTVLDENSLEQLRRDFRTDQLRDATQADALEELTEAFSKREIPFVLMKGIVMKRCYDKPYHRMMGDLDLLIREEDRAAAREVMEGLGYETKLYDELYDDVYYRLPFLNVEIHVALGEDGDFADPYFDTLWERVVPTKESPFCFEMSPEDYYLYFVQHAVKHCRGHGTGIRTLIDFWYARNALLPTLDRAFLDEKLADFKSLKFEKEFYELASVWFDAKPGDAFQNEAMRRFLILDSGLYGQEHNVLFRHAIEDGGAAGAQAKKRGIFLQRIFLPRENMSIKYPVLKKHGWMLPFCWIHRFFKTVFSPGKVRGEAKLYSKITRGMEFQSEMRARFGFTESSRSEENGAE